MEPSVEEFALLLDVRGATPFNMDTKVIRRLINIEQYYYCNRVGSIMVVNNVWFLKIIFNNIIKKILHPKLLSRVHILGKNADALKKFVDVGYLLPEHGGVWPYDHNEWIRKRYDLEGIPYVESPPTPEADIHESDVDETLVKSMTNVSSETVLKSAVHSGVMSKQGAIVKNWKNRFSVLTMNPNLLYYFKSSSSGSPQGVVVLDNAKIVPGAPADLKKDAEKTFQIQTPLRTFYWVCSSTAERDQWVSELNKVVEAISADHSS